MMEGAMKTDRKRVEGVGVDQTSTTLADKVAEHVES